MKHYLFYDSYLNVINPGDCFDNSNDEGWRNFMLLSILNKEPTMDMAPDTFVLDISSMDIETRVRCLYASCIQLCRCFEATTLRQTGNE